MQNEVVDEELD